MAKKTDNQVEGDGRAHKAGALDIRNVIGALLTTYGVILVLLGLFADTAPDKTGDVNANLWAGLMMLAVRGRVPGLGPDPAAGGAAHDGGLTAGSGD